MCVLSATSRSSLSVAWRNSRSPIAVFCRIRTFEQFSIRIATGFRRASGLFGGSFMGLVQIVLER